MTIAAPSPSLSPGLIEQELEAMLAEPRPKATFEEYLAVAGQSRDNVQYINREIHITSQASLPHELLVIRLGYLLTGLFDEQPDLTIYGSNIKIHIPTTGDSYNADVTIIRGEPDYLQLSSGRVSTVEVQNPVLVVEVLSDSTQSFDLGDKPEGYKQLASLEQILFVSKQKPQVVSYVRSETPGVWLNTSAYSLADSLPVLNQPIALADIYRKSQFSVPTQPGSPAA